MYLIIRAEEITGKFFIEIHSPESFTLDSKEPTCTGSLYCDDFFIEYMENKERITFYGGRVKAGSLTVKEICSDLDLCRHSEIAFRRRKGMKPKKVKLSEILPLGGYR